MQRASRLRRLCHAWLRHKWSLHGRQPLRTVRQPANGQLLGIAMHNRQCPSGNSKHRRLVHGCLSSDLCMRGRRSAPPASQAASMAGGIGRQHSTPMPVITAARCSARVHRQQPCPMSEGSHLFGVHKLFEEERCSDGPTHAAAHVLHVCRAAHGSRWLGTEGPTACDLSEGLCHITKDLSADSQTQSDARSSPSSTHKAATGSGVQPDPRQLGALGSCDSTSSAHAGSLELQLTQPH